MIQLYTFMWVLAVFFGVLGALRGWNRELVVTAGAALALYGLFQLDNILRSTVYFLMPMPTIFVFQMAVFGLITFLAYQSAGLIGKVESVQERILGVLVGMFNGYLIGGAFWYFLDINQYPLAPYILAPSPDSPSGRFIGSIPLVLFSGGVTASGNALTLIVVVLIGLVIVLAK